MPLKLLGGLILFSMFTRVVPTDDSEERRNRTKPPMQTIVVQSELDLGVIDSRLSTLESGISKLDSKMSNLESLIAKSFGNANGGIGSQNIGRNNGTSNNIDNVIAKDKVKDKDKNNQMNCASVNCADIDDFYTVFLDQAKSWDEARKSCQEKGTDLVTMTSYAEQWCLGEYLRLEMYPGDFFWVGGRRYDKDKGYKWEWITGEPIEKGPFVWLDDSWDRDGCLGIRPTLSRDALFGFTGLHQCDRMNKEYTKNHGYVCSKKN